MYLALFCSYVDFMDAYSICTSVGGASTSGAWPSFPPSCRRRVFPLLGLEVGAAAFLVDYPLNA